MPQADEYDDDGDAFIKVSVKSYLENIDKKIDRLDKKFDTYKEKSDEKDSKQDEDIIKNSTSIWWIRWFCIVITGTIITGAIKVLVF